MARAWLLALSLLLGCGKTGAKAGDAGASGAATTDAAAELCPPSPEDLERERKREGERAAREQRMKALAMARQELVAAVENGELAAIAPAAAQAAAHVRAEDAERVRSGLISAATDAATLLASCDAVAAGKPEPCERLAPLGEAPVGRCKHRVALLVHVAAKMIGAGACEGVPAEAAATAAGGAVTAADLTALCFAATKKAPAGCDELREPRLLPFCRALAGDGKGCEGQCRDDLALVQAVLVRAGGDDLAAAAVSGDPARCRGEALRRHRLAVDAVRLDEALTP